MTPNQVTAIRVLAAFAAVALFTFGHDALVADATAILLTIAAIALDGVDGYIARKRKLATPLGRSSIFWATAWSKIFSSHFLPLPD
jgi:phosphatidylglycerophosphate synthase